MYSDNIIRMPPDNTFIACDMYYSRWYTLRQGKLWSRCY